MDFEDIPKSMMLEEGCLQKWDTPEFAEKFLDEIQQNHEKLNLEYVCNRGGYIQDNYVEFNGLTIGHIENDVVDGSFAYSFTELVPTGCKDIERSHHQTGVMYYTLDLRDGEVTFEFSHHHGMSGE